MSSKQLTGDSKNSGGCMVVVVGPSGAGKDTVMREAAPYLASLSDVEFVKRVVTRPSDPAREDHHSVNQEEFNEIAGDDGFAVTWTAHNLSYGVPAETLAQVENGGVRIVNGSRAALPGFRRVYSRTMAIWITAPVDVLAARLAKRKNESAEDTKARLERSIAIDAMEGDVIINNSWEIEVSVEQFTDVIKSLCV